MIYPYPTYVGITAFYSATSRGGFEDENGRLTEEAEDMMFDELVKERREAYRKEVAKELLEISKEK